MLQSRLRLSRDILPLSDFRAKSAEFIERVQSTRAPMYITQHGRGVAVLLDIEAYESLLDELETLRAIRSAEEQVAEGRTAPHDAVEKRLRARLGR